MQKLLTSKRVYGIIFIVAGMVKLADTPVLEAGAERREGSSPFTRTIFYLIDNINASVFLLTHYFYIYHPKLV